MTKRKRELPGDTATVNEYLRMHTNGGLNRIINVCMNAELAGFAPVPGSVHDKEMCKRILKERERDTTG